MSKSYFKYFIFSVVSFIICSWPIYAEEEIYYTNMIKKIYSMGTASINGTYYPLGNAICRLLGRKLKKIIAIAEPTAGSVANVEYLRKKRIDLALMQSDVAWMAYHGSFSYAGNPYKELRVLASLYSEKIQIVVRADSGINSLEDLRGKKIAVGEKYSGSAAAVKQILEAAGLSHENDYELIYERFTKSTESLFDGYIDAVYYVGAVPADGISRLANKIPIKLIEIPQSIILKLTSAFPYYTSERINANSYKGLSKDINTLSIKALLACTDRLSLEEALSILTVIYSNNKLFSERNEYLIDIKREEALNGVDTSMLHEGAAKFFSMQNEGK